MSENPFVKAYLRTAEQEEAEKLAYRQSVMEEGLPKFVANCKIWLGEMWDECEIREPLAKVDPGNGIHFFQPFIWEGIEGGIESGYWGRMSPTRRAGLAMPIVTTSLQFSEGHRMEQGSFRLTFSLPIENDGEPAGARYNDLAIAPKVNALGKFLLEVLAAKEKWDKARAEYQAGQLRLKHNSLFNNIQYADDEANLTAALEKATNEMPDDRQFWEERASIRREKIKEAQEAVAAQDKLRSDWAAEQDRLVKVAAEIFQPFTIYRVRYGAKSAVEGEDYDPVFYETEDWSAYPVPDITGWWLMLRYGEVTRVRIQSLIAVEEHRVAKPGDVPSGSLAWKNVESEKFPGMSADAWDLSPVLEATR